MTPVPGAVRVVLVTAPEGALAEALARALLERRAAACVNVLPGVRSLYRWKGEICDDREVLLVVKTTAHRLEELKRIVHEVHPHEVAEMIALDVTGGTAPYLDWVREETGAGEG